MNKTIVNEIAQDSETQVNPDVESRHQYTLIGRDGKPYKSDEPGLLGGHKKLKIYGRLDCPSALRHIAKGNYVKYIVFFADEETAIAAGYRPCGVCMKEEYKKWKAAQNEIQEAQNRKRQNNAVDNDKK